MGGGRQGVPCGRGFTGKGYRHYRTYIPLQHGSGVLRAVGDVGEVSFKGDGGVERGNAQILHYGESARCQEKGKKNR